MTNIYSFNSGQCAPFQPLKSGVHLALLFFTLILTPAYVLAGETKGIPDWKPQSGEKLVKLPATYLKKSIDSDFAQSKLGLAIDAIQEKSRLKVQSLTDLHQAVNHSDGEIKTELRHQLLAEKRSYIEIMSDKNQMRRKQLVIKQRLFEDMLKKLGERDTGMTTSKRYLLEKQEAAKNRFESSLSAVDVRLFANSAIPESKYSKKYSKNMTAINQLVSRIESHRMNASLQVDGQALTKEEYIRQLLANAESEIAIVEQEETILGYMAKLVALDALSLSEEAIDVELADSDLPSDNGPAGAAPLFLNN